MTPKEFAEMWVSWEFKAHDDEINAEVLANLIDRHFVPISDVAINCVPICINAKTGKDNELIANIEEMSNWLESVIKQRRGQVDTDDTH